MNHSGVLAGVAFYLGLAAFATSPAWLLGVYIWAHQ